MFTARFADCHFDENNFPALRGEKKQLEKKIQWNAELLNQFDPRTKQCEHEVQRIIHLQNIANQLPAAFTDPKKVTKSHIPAENAPIRIQVLEEKSNTIANEHTTCLKRGRPIGFKDKNPQKKKGANKENGQTEEINILDDKDKITDKKSPEEIRVPKNNENNEISISYVGKYGIDVKILSTMFLHTM